MNSKVLRDGAITAGLVAATATGLAAGCSDTTKSDVREGMRQAGEEVGEAAKDVEDATKKDPKTGKIVLHPIRVKTAVLHRLFPGWSAHYAL